ncbi:hypothetical protein [Streptomyces sp900129855]|uniref:Extracellular solute-binding protein n=1 Tax=Streptomyces sp. 900129855 TaxID=3155129 RepID=A0ABV2ZR44_9ACTN
MPGAGSSIGISEVHIDLGGANCTRVADLLQPLSREKAVTTVLPIDPGFATFGKDDKLLMLPAPAWFGDLMFGPAFKVSKGRIAAAPMPTWPGESKPYAGQVGGGAFLVSAHAGARTEQATDLVRWMTTDVLPPRGARARRPAAGTAGRQGRTAPSVTSPRAAETPYARPSLTRPAGSRDRRPALRHSPRSAGRRPPGARSAGSTGPPR